MAYLNVFEYSSIIEKRREEILELLYENLEPNEGDTYYIIDPFIIASDQIQEPFKQKRYDLNMWSYFLSTILLDEVKIKIITTKTIENLPNPNKTLPQSIIFNENYKVTIEICQFKNKNDLARNQELHDRYIIKIDNQNTITALHIGPSLGHIDNKDITITYFSDNLKPLVKSRFEQLWEICLKNEWY